MMISRNPRILTVLCTAFLTMGCVESKNPLSDPDQSRPDEHLHGNWQRKDEIDSWPIKRIVIGPCAERISRPDIPVGIMRASITLDSDEQKVFQELFFVSPLGDGNYANLIQNDAILDQTKYQKWDKNNIPSYQLIKYQLEGDNLKLWICSPKTLLEAIASTSLWGEVTQDRYFTSVKLSDSTENLAKFFKKPGEKFIETDAYLYVRKSKQKSP